MLDLLVRLRSVPVRPESILDSPFEEYVELIEHDDVAEIFDLYARGRPQPTLRAVLAHAGFQRWIEVGKGGVVRTRMAKELALLVRITDEEEHILGPFKEAASATRGEAALGPEPPTEPEALAEWVRELGLGARLRDPATVLASRATRAGGLYYVLRDARRLTVGDMLLGSFDRRQLPLANGDFAGLSAYARSHLLALGAQALEARREAGRVGALAYRPTGEGAGEFLTAIDTALAATSTSVPLGMTLESIAIGYGPVRFDVGVSLVDAKGKTRNLAVSVDLEDWRAQPLQKAIRCSAKEGRAADVARFVLLGLRGVIADRAHPFHEPCIALLNEPSWARLFANLDEVSRLVDPGYDEQPIAWQVTSDRDVQIVPIVRERIGGAPIRASTLSALEEGHHGVLTALDEAVTAALRASPVTSSAYGYAVAPRSTPREIRARNYRALSLLADHEDVRGRGGVRLRVVEGALGVSLAEEEAGYRFVFDVDGEMLSAPEIRDALDLDGYLIHIAPLQGRVLLAHEGTRRATILRTLASEKAVFPAAARAGLVDRVARLATIVPIVLPESLAGEPIDADARPLVRVVRDGFASLSLQWLVRPIAGGETFAPGAGPVQLLQQVAGRGVFAARSFAEERRRADAARDALLGALPTAGADAATRFEGIAAVLAVLAALRALADASAITVEWPKTMPRLVGRLVWSKLQLRATAQRDWFGLSGDVAVDGVTITLADLLAARRSGEPFIVVGTDKLVLIEEELRARLGALEGITRTTKGAELALAPAAVPALTELLDARDQLEAAPAFWSLVERIDAATASDPRIPRGFSKVLRSYQVDGFRWMSRLAAWGAGACLADEMGLGKTVQTLALLVSRSKLGPALVIAPTSVGPNWIAEAKRFAPSLNPILHRGAGRAATLSKLDPGTLLVTSYDLVARDIDDLEEVEFATLVADEAQAIKNGETSRAKAVRSLRADFRLALTGTPVENRLSELFSLMEFLNPGFFGSESEFRERFVIPVERDKDPARSDALGRLIRPFVLRRKKAHVLTELPARTEVLRSVECSPAEKRLYEAARQLAIAALTGAEEDARFRILAELMRLRRLACHPRLDDDTSKVPSSKLSTFLEIVAELREAGHRALVFSQFTGHLALVQEALKAQAIPYLYLDGRTPLAERTKRVAAFQAGEGELFLISLKAGGTGLNLTGADTVIHLDPWWNPAVEDQATDRAHRIGQKRPVTVIRLIAQGTIEEAVMALHDGKRQLAESILEGTATSGKLSIAQLGALIREGMTG